MSDTQWIEDIGLDVTEGIGYTGGRARYLSALKRYYDSYEKNISKINESLSAEKYEDYTIIVHALKSNSRMIGAPHLGDAFEALETAGRNSDISTIKNDTQAVLDEYKTLVEKLTPIKDMSEELAADEISGDEARQVADELLEALDDFDDEKSKELVIKLSGYPFRISGKDLLKKATEYIDDFMYDEAADVVRQVVSAIE